MTLKRNLKLDLNKEAGKEIIYSTQSKMAMTGEEEKQSNGHMLDGFGTV